MNIKKTSLITFVLAFSINGTAQTQIGQDIIGSVNFDGFGRAVTMPESTTIGLGSFESNVNGSMSGKAEVYTLINGVWTQKGQSLNGENAQDWFGYAIDMPTSDLVVVGIPYFNNGAVTDAGKVVVYEWNGSQWIQKGQALLGLDELGHFGSSVSMADENTLVVGSEYGRNTLNVPSGEVMVYQWNGSQWVQKGVSINGQSMNEKFGLAVQMPHPDFIAIGAPGYDGAGVTDGGLVRIYHWNGMNWMQVGTNITGLEAGAEFGRALSFPDTTTIAIGAPNSSSGQSLAGQVRVLDWTGTVWQQRGPTINGITAEEAFGWAISMANENTMVVGAPGYVVNQPGTGIARFYKWNGQTWNTDFNPVYGANGYDRCGNSVAMSDVKTFAIGSPGFSQNIVYGGKVNVFGVCSAEILASAYETCNPDTVTLMSHPADAASYQWSFNNTVLVNEYSSQLTINQTGNYALTVIDSTGCTYSTSPVTITFHEPPTVSIAPITTLFCPYSQPYTLVEGTPSGGMYSGDGVENGVFDPALNGVGQNLIEYTYTDVNGCRASATETITVDDCAGLAEMNNDQTISLFPNPATNWIQLTATDVISEIAIFNCVGELVYETDKFSSESGLIDIHFMAGGTYTLVVKTQNNYSRFKLVVTE